MSEESKIARFMEKQELVSFFRDVADALEKGGKPGLEALEDFRKLKIGVKNEFGQLELKMKIKPEKQEAAAADASGQPGLPKYKTLKKRMKSSFKMIFTMLHDGAMPPEQAVESFLSDSDLMVRYAGYGDEYYEDYTKACESFRKAYEAGDVQTLVAAVDALAEQKGRCHAKYD